MKLHPSVIDKLINLFENFGGQVDNKNLRAKLLELSLMEYTRKTGKLDTVLVLTEDFAKVLKNSPK